MTFPYEEIANGIFRPIIPIILKSNNIFIVYYALIDSGADNCIFSIGIAKKLNIKLKNKNKVNFHGVGPEEIKGFWGKIDIRTGGVTYESKVIFADIADFGHGILGQKGFFDHFDVKLSYHKQVIELENISTKN